VHRLADGHRVVVHGGQAHHAGLVQRRPVVPTAAGRATSVRSEGRRRRRQSAVGRRVPAGGRRGTAAGRARPTAAAAAGQNVVGQKVAGRRRGRRSAERRGRFAATERGRRQRRRVRRDGQTGRVAGQPDGRRQEARRRRLEEQRVQPVRQ